MKINGHYKHVFILFKHDMLWRPKIKSKVGRPHTMSPLKCRCGWCKLAHFIFLLLIVTIGPWFSMHILIIVDSVRVITIVAKSLFAMRLEFQLISTIIPPPVPWNSFILFGTYIYTSNLLCQLSFGTIFQGRHWLTVHEKIRLVHQNNSSVKLTFRYWDMSVGEILFPGGMSPYQIKKVNYWAHTNGA